MDASAKPSALFLAPEAPYPLVGGGALRSASLLEYLGRRYELDVILFRQPGEPDPGCQLPPGLAARVLVLDLAHHSRRTTARALRTAGRFVRGVPPLSDRFAGYGTEIETFLGASRYELAVIEHFWCAAYWGQLSLHSSRVILDLHNIESALMARRAEVSRFPARLVFRRFERANRRSERLWLARFSLLLAASDVDAAALRAANPASRVLVYPNALPWWPLPQATEQHVIAFSGNFEYDPNTDAVKYFQRRMWPLLRERWPKLIWRLIGRNPQAVRDCVGGDPRIQLTGPVDNAVEALRPAAVVIAPLRMGSGTRVKILEAWAAGRAVVSTTLGAEGLPARNGEHLLVADGPAEFAGAVSALLDSTDLRERVGVAGRRLYEEAFQWESAWQRLRKAGI